MIMVQFEDSLRQRSSPSGIGLIQRKFYMKRYNSIIHGLTTMAFTQEKKNFARAK
jgi:hypothetical protein